MRLRADQYHRVWNGLVNLMAAYQSPSSGYGHTPMQQKIAALFYGKSEAQAEAIAVAMEKRQADRAVEELKAELAEAERERAALDGGQ